MNPRDPSPEQIHQACTLPVQNFYESIGLDDAKPFMLWEPSPSQIARWGQQIQAENFQRRIDELEPADDYETHSARADR